MQGGGSSSLLGARLKAGAEELGLAIDARRQALLLRYIQLLTRWNQTYNLTAVRDPVDMVSLHLLDSLSVSGFVRGERVLDIGTGAGLPGIPLAITQPDRYFVLLDSNGKKTRFVQQAVIELGLKNVGVRRARIETFQSEQAFDTLLARAFASISDILDKTRHLLGPEGLLVAMKGVHPETEIDALNGGSFAFEMASVRVPYVDGERNIVLISRALSR